MHTFTAGILNVKNDYRKCGTHGNNEFGFVGQVEEKENWINRFSRSSPDDVIGNVYYALIRAYLQVDSVTFANRCIICFLNFFFHSTGRLRDQ